MKRTPKLAVAIRKHQTTPLPKKKRIVLPVSLLMRLKVRFLLLVRLEQVTTCLKGGTKVTTIMWDVMKMDAVVETLILVAAAIRELERIGTTIVTLITAQEIIVVITEALSKGITN